MSKNEKSFNFIDSVISEHRKSNQKVNLVLDDIKRNKYIKESDNTDSNNEDYQRNSSTNFIKEYDEYAPQDQMNNIYSKSNINSFETNANLQIKELPSRFNSKHRSEFIENHCNQDFPQMNNNFTKQNKENDPVELKRKVESKRSKIKILKEKLNNYIEENDELKRTLNSFENNAERSKGLDEKYVDREREILSALKESQEQRYLLEEEYKKLKNEYTFKSKEYDLLNQKINDFEIILNENSNDYAEQIRHLNAEKDEIKQNIGNYEKMLEFLVYFFNKTQNLYKKKDKNKSSNNYLNIKQLDLTKLQEELIELENYIITLRNDKVNSDGKYSKLIEIQSKITDNDAFDYTKTHLETIKKLNEKIFDLSEQNKVLSEQLQIAHKDTKGERPIIKSKSISEQRPDSVQINNNNKTSAIDKYDSTEELKNVKINNVKIYQTNNENFRTISNNNIDSNKSPSDPEKNNNIQIMYKMLETRINELEKEVSLKKAGVSYNSTEALILENLRGKFNENLITNNNMVNTNTISTLNNVSHEDNKPSSTNRMQITPKYTEFKGTQNNKDTNENKAKKVSNSVAKKKLPKNGNSKTIENANKKKKNK